MLRLKSLLIIFLFSLNLYSIEVVVTNSKINYKEIIDINKLSKAEVLSVKKLCIPLSVKELKNKTPIIILTSLVDIDNIAIGYELGCDDYLKKPFELKELELRINALIKKYYKTDSKTDVKLACGYVFDFVEGTLARDDKTIILTQREQDLVRFLINRKNSYCEIESLRENVWEGKEVSYADIRMYIRKIRLKTSKEFIKTSRGLGYKIDVPF